MEQLKLLKTNQDVIIEALTEKISDLEIQNRYLKKENDLKRNELEYYNYMSKEKEQFKYYLIFKDKLNDVLSSDDYYSLDIDDIKYEFECAFKEKDADKMHILFTRLLSYQSPELLGIIEEQNQLIEDLNTDIDELKETLREYE